jgi:uncharacterized protein YdeI (YjbR/CyaY-like superfamily)
MPALPNLEMHTTREWREWLAQNHTASQGVWLVSHKDHTRVPSVPYEDSVREALCFGWIDSLIKRLDGDRYARKFTPRKPTSKWSDLNRKRWGELKAAGRLKAAGLANTPTDHRYAPKPKIPELPAYFAKALKANPKAWAYFRELPRGQRRNFVVWIHMARREETRAKRIREAIRLLARREKLGLK